MKRWLSTLSKRERQLGGFMLLAVIIFVVAQVFSGSDEADASSAKAPLDADALEASFSESVKQLERAPQILAAYDRLDVKLPQAEDVDSLDLAFSTQLARLCSDSGFTLPPIEAARVEKIPSVDDYELLSASMRPEGTFAEVARLLRILEGNGLILRDVEIHGTRDRDYVRGRITVARIAPVPKRFLDAYRKRRSHT